jgi:hypothetical protein
MRVGADMILPSTVIVAEILLKNKSGEEEKNRK